MLQRTYQPVGKNDRERQCTDDHYYDPHLYRSCQSLHLHMDHVCRSTCQDHANHGLSILVFHNDRNGHLNKTTAHIVAGILPLKATHHFFCHHDPAFFQLRRILDDLKILVNNNDPSIIKRSQLGQFPLQHLIFCLQQILSVPELGGQDLTLIFHIIAQLRHSLPLIGHKKYSADDQRRNCSHKQKKKHNAKIQTFEKFSLKLYLMH